MATYCSILAWEIPRIEEPGVAESDTTEAPGPTRTSLPLQPSLSLGEPPAERHIFRVHSSELLPAGAPSWSLALGAC